MVGDQLQYFLKYNYIWKFQAFAEVTVEAVSVGHVVSTWHCEKKTLECMRWIKTRHGPTLHGQSQGLSLRNFSYAEIFKFSFHVLPKTSNG